MSIPLDNWTVPPSAATPRTAASGPQLLSWLATPLLFLLQCIERTRERRALRVLAENQHLLDDIGVSRRDALREAATPFWR